MSEGGVKDKFAKLFEEAEFKEKESGPYKEEVQESVQNLGRVMDAYFKTAEFASNKKEFEKLCTKLFFLYETQLRLILIDMGMIRFLFNPIKILKLLKIQDFEEARLRLPPLLDDVRFFMAFRLWWNEKAKSVLSDVKRDTEAAFILFEVANALHEEGQEDMTDYLRYAKEYFDAMEVATDVLKRAAAGTTWSAEFKIKCDELETQHTEAMKLCKELKDADNFLNKLMPEDGMHKIMKQIVSRFEPRMRYDKDSLQKASREDIFQLMLEIYDPENQVDQDKEWTLKCKYITNRVKFLMNNKSKEDFQEDESEEDDFQENESEEDEFQEDESERKQKSESNSSKKYPIGERIQPLEAFVKSIFGETLVSQGKFSCESVPDEYAKKGATAVVESDVTSDQRKKSDQLLDKLPKTSKVAFDQLKNLAANSGCKLMMEDENESDLKSGSNIDSLVEMFMKEESETSSSRQNTKRQFEFFLPSNLMTNETFLNDEEEVFVKKSIIASVSNYFNCDNVEDVQVKINEDFHVEVVVQNSGSEDMEEKVRELAEKNKNVTCYKIKDVRQKQMACFKLRPTDFDPDNDFVFTCDEHEERLLGGVNYIQPNKHWVRIALNTKNRGYESDEWLQTWTYGFHGSDLGGNREIAKQRTLNKDGKRQIHENDKDVNGVSERKGKICGKGAYYANDVRVAYLYTLSKLREGMDGRYCVFEVRLNPSKTRIPEGNGAYRIINETQYARPTGILVLVDEAHLSDIGMVAKERLLDLTLRSTNPNHKPDRCFLTEKVNKIQPQDKLQFNQITSLLQPTRGRPKVILIVGPSQSGKTTFLNGLLNHLLEVDFDDTFRFEIESDKRGFSMYTGAVKHLELLPTEWISSYSFQGYKHCFTFVDTPGYGSQNTASDTNLDSRILKFFQEKVEQHSLDQVDAICFVRKTQSHKLTSYDKYVTQRIFSTFGKNVESKLFLIATCCGFNLDPPEDDNRYVHRFAFENASLYANNVLDSEGERAVVKKQWDFNKGNYTMLLEFISRLQSDCQPTLDKTIAVLQKRLAVEQTINDLQQRVQGSLFKGANLEKVIRTLLRSTEKTIKVVTAKPSRVDRPRKDYATKCLVCIQTCHDDCFIKDPEDMYMCAGMDASMTPSIRTCCACGCHWMMHRNEDTFFIVEEEVIEKSLADFQKQFGVKAGTEFANVKLEHAMKLAVQEERTEMLKKIVEIKVFLEELASLALVPIVTSMTDYIDQLMKKENSEKKFGYEDRLEELKKAKNRAQLIQDIPNLTLEQILSEFDKQSAGQ